MFTSKYLFGFAKGKKLKLFTASMVDRGTYGIFVYGFIDLRKILL